ncbi:MAG: hypothetical protein GX787_04020 [Tissierellia bacterium]|jgi:hypothetical protein|nr:hypothetical protein [Tissierellia bacterium]
MKTNREFLNGVYAKAEILEKEKNKSKKSPRMFYRFGSIAALIILIPTIFFWNSNRAYEELISPMMVRTIDDPMSYFGEADFIVIGKTEKINESQYIKEGNYIYTDIDINIMEVLKGEVNDGAIVIRVNGGKVKKEKLKSKMDSEFIKGENSLLFLRKDESGIYSLVSSESQFIESGRDLFKDKLGNEYTLDEIKNIIMEELN